MNKDEFYRVSASHFPETALDYCCDLWLLYHFNFKITRDRKTKLGDFRYDKRKSIFQVTVNHGLNPYAFLITYIHEVAHVDNYKQYGGKVNPHGPEWQDSFRKLAEPLLNSEVFPAKVLKAFRDYLQKPSASSGGHLPLSEALHQYDSESRENLLLAHLGEGSKFIFKDRTFVKEGRKRTRAICTDLRSGRKYLIPEAAQVNKVA